MDMEECVDDDNDESTEKLDEEKGPKYNPPINMEESVHEVMKKMKILKNLMRKIGKRPKVQSSY